MLKRIVTGLALIAATALVVPDAAYAKGGGRGGGGGHGFQGGGGGGGARHFGGGGGGGVRHFGGGGRWQGGGNWHGGGKYYGGGRYYGGRGWRGYGWGVPAAVAVGAVGAYYAAPYYYDDGCYQNVRVMTPYGPQWQAVNVCY